MFDDARSRFGDARRGAPTASRHAQWSSAVKPRFWGSTLKFTVKSLKWYTYISTKCHGDMCISFHLNMTWILRKDKPFNDDLVGSWVKAVLGSTVVSTWLGPPRLAWKDESCEEKLFFLFGCKGCKAGIISYGDNTFSKRCKRTQANGQGDLFGSKVDGRWPHCNFGVVYSCAACGCQWPQAQWLIVVDLVAVTWKCHGGILTVVDSMLQLLKMSLAHESAQQLKVASISTRIWRTMSWKIQFRPVSFLAFTGNRI